MNLPESTTVFVGISGGVDSAVAALLLHKQGYQVEAVFMKNWDEDDDEHCSAEQDLADARTICEHIGIPLRTINFSSEYWDRVFEHFLTEYRSGRTPNPDILCNREIKFGAFLDYARSQSVDLIATGHYARTIKFGDDTGLRMAADRHKDQTYFLHTLSSDQLTSVLFPLGETTKPEVRLLAREQGLRIHDKKDSTGICFIGERRFQEFLARYVTRTPGPMINEDGAEIGTHAGLPFYTIGQRQGLGIGGGAGGSGEPWYVADKFVDENTLVVVQGKNHPRLFSSGLRTETPHWINHPPALPLHCQARLRHQHDPAECTVRAEYDRLVVTFDRPQRAIAPGQSVVFYNGDVCLGGAVIATAIEETGQ